MTRRDRLAAWTLLLGLALGLAAGVWEIWERVAG